MKMNMFLSPTNEEAMVELVKNRVTSYKGCYQLIYTQNRNTKFRDVRLDLDMDCLRGREFHYERWLLYVALLA